MTFLSRQERFARVGSTNDAVRSWLAGGTPEVCLAVADEQTAGRGRDGRAWLAPAGAALLLSLGFRPAWLDPGHAWRLAAVVSLAMADAAETTAGLRDRAIRLKWPNDLVVEDEAGGGPLRKLAGVLGEIEGLGTDDPRVVVGIGLNAGWRRADFPAALAAAMTSLDEASGGRPVDRAALLDGFLSRLEARLEALRAGWFAVDDWVSRQVTTGRLVRLEQHGGPPQEALAVGVDTATGALLVEAVGEPGGERPIHAGEVVRVRLAGPARDGAAAGAAPSAPSAGGRV